MQEFDPIKFDQLLNRLDAVSSYLHLGDVSKKVKELEKECADPSFWQDQDSARQTLAELNREKKKIASYTSASEFLEDGMAAWELAEGEDAQELIIDAIDLCDKCERVLSDLEISSWFTDDIDFGDAIITITPGLGGLEAQDWCEMLFKMYLKYCSSRGWKTTVAEAHAAEAIGIDRAVFSVEGDMAYGMLKAEQGVHRLVRISPTDEKKRRQTTFAGVEVIPSLPSDIEIEVDPNDIRDRKSVV